MSSTNELLELKVLGVKTLSDVQGFFSGTLGAAVNIVKETPNIALTGLKAVGNFGNILSGGDRDFDCGNSTETANPVAATVDPALQSASEIESQLSRLQNIFEEDLLKMLQGGKTDDLRDCVSQMRAMSGSLGDGPYSQMAAGILKKGITFGEIALGLQPNASSIDPESKEWNDKLRKWQVLFENIQGTLLQLQSAAASQAGQGFGNNTSSCPSDLNGVNLQSLMALRQNKLLMMETAMKNAEDNVRRITRQNQATQTKMIQLAHQMKQLDHSKAKLEDTKKVLVEAMEVLYEIRNGFNKIKKTFDLLAGYIDIQINDQTLVRLTHAMESATGRMSTEDMLCYQIKARTIVDLVLQMRGQFMFIYEMAKLYSRISQDYIVPCIEHMGSLKVSKLATSDEQAAEKAYIDDFTTKCSQAIIKIAQADMEKFQKDMKARCMEIREESRLQGLDRLVSQAHRAAIEDAMSQASDRIIEQETSRIEVLEKKIEKSSETIINDTCFD